MAWLAHVDVAVDRHCDREQDVRIGTDVIGGAAAVELMLKRYFLEDEPMGEVHNTFEKGKKAALSLAQAGIDLVGSGDGRNRAGKVFEEEDAKNK